MDVSYDEIPIVRGDPDTPGTSERPATRFELVREDPGGLVVKIAGELDVRTVPEVDAAVAPLIAIGTSSLAVDASRLEFVDSSAIALWIRWANALGHIEIRNPSTTMRSQITRLGLAHRLRLQPYAEPGQPEQSGLGGLGELETPAASPRPAGVEPEPDPTA